MYTFWVSLDARSFGACLAGALIIGLPSISAAESWQWHFNEGNSYFKQGRWGNAQKEYSESLALNPNFASAYFYRGVTFDRQGNNDRALEDYNRAIAIDPNKGDYYIHRGGAYAAKADYERAISDYDRALRLEPNDSYAIQGRKYAYHMKAKKERELEQSRAKAESIRQAQEKKAADEKAAAEAKKQEENRLAKESPAAAERGGREIGQGYTTYPPSPRDDQLRQAEEHRRRSEEEGQYWAGEKEKRRQAEMADSRRKAEAGKAAAAAQAERNRLDQERKAAAEAAKAENNRLEQERKTANEAALAELSRQTRERQAAVKADMAERGRLAMMRMRAVQSAKDEKRRIALELEEKASAVEAAWTGKNRPAQEEKTAAEAAQAQEDRLAEERRAASEAALAEEGRLAHERQSAAEAALAGGIRLAKEGKADLAAKSLERALALFPESVPVLNWLGSIYCDLGQHEKAIAMLDAAAKGGGPGSAWNYYLGLSLIKGNRLADARAVLESGLADGPNKNRGQDMKEASRKLVLSLDAHQAHLERAAQLEAIGDSRQAIAEVSAALKALETVQAKMKLEKLRQRIDMDRKSARESALSFVGGAVAVVLAIAGCLYALRVTKEAAGNEKQVILGPLALQIRTKARTDPVASFAALRQFQTFGGDPSIFSNDELHSIMGNSGNQSQIEGLGLSKDRQERLSAMISMGLPAIPAGGGSGVKAAARNARRAAPARPRPSTVLKTANGDELRLGLELGKGGEGSVYSITGQPGYCVKLYDEAKPASAQLHDKLKVMAANPPKDPTIDSLKHHSICWPTKLVYRGSPEASNFAGFVMPAISETAFKKAICRFHPDDRRKYSGGKFTWLHAYTSGLNIASAVAAIHERGYCIGDINESNILVAEDTLAAIIDCDSFQVREPGTGRVFRCVVGKGEYSAPELIGKVYAEVDRTPESDHFGLAVLLFQFLMEGCHPYQARGPLVEEANSTDKKISLGHFPYRHAAKPEGVSPPVYAPDFDILHPDLQRLFVRAFVDGHKNPAARPTSRELFDGLRGHRKEIVECGANAAHRYFNHLGKCPWCRLREEKGQDPFVPAAGAKGR